jgi:pseudouridine-5'-phosphate glycosidase
MAVVCSGAKSILDLPRTLEMLETLGVTIAGLGTGELPAFYSRSSGLRIPCVSDVAEAASLVRHQAALGWAAAVVIANPPPVELAMPAAEVDALVIGALEAADRAGVHGNQETPFLLAHMAGASDGRTVTLNERLVLDNARIAAALARALV